MQAGGDHGLATILRFGFFDGFEHRQNPFFIMVDGKIFETKTLSVLEWSETEIVAADTNAKPTIIEAAATKIGAY